MRLIASLCTVFVQFFLTATAFSQPLACQSFDGLSVPYISNPGLQNVGIAQRLPNGQPVIQVNPMVLSSLPEVVRQFWYAHECAHHALPPMMNSEIAADCYAIKTIRNLGIVQDASDVQYLLASIAGLPGNLQTGHLPGRERAQNIFSCMSTP